MQELVWYLTVVLVASIGAVFIMVVVKARPAVEYGSVQASAYRLRTKIFWGLVIAGLAMAAATLRGLPYVALDAAPASQIVTATGSQWYWELDRKNVAIGQPVEFRVTSTDVNHGLGIYDADNRLLTQAQAMPGYINRLRYTFEKPGTYRLLCLEYCGLAHHDMVAEIEVRAP